MLRRKYRVPNFLRIANRWVQIGLSGDGQAASLP
jgi:hypothetical protein